MKRWAFLTTAMFFFLAGRGDAAPPIGAAAGLYLVEYPRALFAFRVDPWSDDLRAIRGIGRGTFGENDEFDVFFEIRGTYRPNSSHAAQGVFLYRGSDYVKHVTWKGTFDPQQNKFQWAIVHSGQTQSLLPAEPPTEERQATSALRHQTIQDATALAPERAAVSDGVPPSAPPTGGPPAPNSARGVANIASGNSARADSPSSPTNATNATGSARVTAATSPNSSSATASAKQSDGNDSSRVTGLRAEYNDFLPEEWQDGELGIDFPKTIVYFVSSSAESANAREAAAAKGKPTTAPQPIADTPEQARRKRVLAENLDILDKITDVKSGYQDAGMDPLAEAVKKILPADSSPDVRPREAIRRRSNDKSIDHERVLRRLKKPSELGPGSLPKDEPAPTSTSTTILFNPSRPTVPNVVGLSIEGAVTALWEVGLTPRSVECLGQSTDPTQADRVTQQIPAAGSPSPADGNVSLQWYSKPTDASVPTPAQAVETKPAESPPTAPTPTNSAVGFQPGDGAKVEDRFAGAQVYADGRGIAFASGGAGGGMNWLIGKLDEPMFQVGVAGAKEAVQRLSQSRSSSDTVVTITRSGNGLIDMSSRNGDGSGTTYCYQYEEYRGFFINYAESVNTPGAALSAKAAAAIEKSRRLIDLRFPK